VASGEGSGELVDPDAVFDGFGFFVGDDEGLAPSVPAPELAPEVGWVGWEVGVGACVVGFLVGVGVGVGVP
jgi:hypothetical protein